MKKSVMLRLVAAAISIFFCTNAGAQAYPAKPIRVVVGFSAGGPTGGSAHLAAALLETTAGVKMTHVPFRGNAPALAEIIGGRVIKAAGVKAE